MKIIKQGELPENKTHQKSCSNCHTIFEFTEKEVKHHFDQRDGDYKTIDCPLCKKMIYV